MKQYKVFFFITINLIPILNSINDCIILHIYITDCQKDRQVLQLRKLRIITSYQAPPEFNKSKRITG